MVIESIISDFERGDKVSTTYNDTDSEEGAKILKILETAAEPEIIMAEMSPEQLTSFATYQAKMEVGFRFFAWNLSLEQESLLITVCLTLGNQTIKHGKKD